MRPRKYLEYYCKECDLTVKMKVHETKNCPFCFKRMKKIDSEISNYIKNSHLNSSVKTDKEINA